MAARLLEAHAGGPLIDPLRETALRDAREVYRVQDLVLHQLAQGARASAWKAVPPRPGAEAAASPLPPACVVASPARLPAPAHLLGVEAEVAFRLGASLQPEEALVTIELCATRVADWASAPALWKLADFQSNAALVLGSGTSEWRTIDFGAQAAELFVNGMLEKRAVGAHPAGDPARLLPWMLEHCGRRGGLQRGDVITTGSWVGLVEVRAGDEVLACFPGIGEARLTLAG